MKTRYMMSVAALLALACFLGVTQTSSALLLTLSSDEYIGQSNDGAPADAITDAARINALIVLAANDTGSVAGDLLTRSDNEFVDLPEATPVGSIKQDFAEGDPAITVGGTTLIDLGSGWMYLLAKYDGQNFGDAIWYVGDLSGVVEIPDNIPTDNQWGLSHWALFNPGTSVPDSGVTAMLLGMAMLGLAGLKRLIGG
ncbi:MAG: VPDSG-CTERM sorting domain-containing protein [Lentisphaerae bacterium]|nr:VPDSG-CTERM sorting domain-containing protein [Lentisphaerota bacterium]